MLGRHKRLLVYALVGLVFGIIDWYYLDLLAHFPWGDLGNNPIVVPIIIALNFGIWLVPVLPVTYHESQQSGSVLRSAASGAMVWSASMISYYTWYTLLLLFWGLPNLDHLLFARRNQPGYWQDLGSMFKRVIQDQFIDWLPIAIIGGSLVGLVVWRITMRKKQVKPAETAAP